jgi:CheY-like chemotaxis protein
VLGCTQLLQDTSLTDAQRQLIQTIHRSAEALLVLVNDILDFSKIEAGKMMLETADVHLRPLIDDVLTLVSELARKKGLALTVEIAPDVPGSLRGDPVRLRQILFNLVGNAIKFTETGSVAVCVTRCQAHAHLPDSILLGWSITDTGIGMTEAQQAKLFQAYTQAEASTSRKFGGTGLGLMICRQLVELMGGELSVRSRVGQGTTFSYTTLLLPAIQREAAGPVVGEVFEPVMSHSSPKKVLVADDNEINQVVACKFLQKLGYEVEVVRNGREAVEALARTAYSAVLMDCEMPEMDGYEATKVIRQREQGREQRVPIIALTGHVSPEDERMCKEAGMDVVVTKPVTLPVLRLTLDRILQRT